MSLNKKVLKEWADLTQEEQESGQWFEVPECLLDPLQLKNMTEVEVAEHVRQAKLAHVRKLEMKAVKKDS